MSNTFPAQGQYHYLLNGLEVDIEERWTAERIEQRLWRVHSTRRVPGLLIDVVADLQVGNVSRCDVRWLAQGESEICARYHRVSTGIEYSRTEQGKAAIQKTIAAQPGEQLVLYPLMRIFTGPVISILAGQGGSGRVLVPDIRTPGNRSSLLGSDISSREVRCEHAVAIDESASELTHWRFIGGQYSDDASFWLNEEGLLQRYCWNQGYEKSWDVRLR